jgi:hypothetical protein
MVFVMSTAVACTPAFRTTTRVRYRDPEKVVILPQRAPVATPEPGDGRADRAPDGDLEPLLGKGRAEAGDGSGGPYEAHAIRMPDTGAPGLRWTTPLALFAGTEQPVVWTYKGGETGELYGSAGFDLTDDTAREDLVARVEQQLGADPSHPATSSFTLPACARLGASYVSTRVGKITTSHQEGFAGSTELPCTGYGPIQFSVATPWSNVREIRTDKIHGDVDSAFWMLLGLASALTVIGGIGTVVLAENPHSGAGTGAVVSGYAFGAIVWGGVFALLPSYNAKDESTVHYPPKPGEGR